MVVSYCSGVLARASASQAGGCGSLLKLERSPVVRALSAPLEVCGLYCLLEGQQFNDKPVAGCPNVSNIVTGWCNRHVYGTVHQCWQHLKPDSSVSV